MKVALTYFRSLRDPQGQRVSTTWEKLLDRLAVPRVSADKASVPGLSLATFRGDRRAMANVERAYALGVDLDHLDALSVYTTRPAVGGVIEAPSWDVLRRTFDASAAFVHTTWSSTMASPRLRVFLLLSRPVDASEYRRVYQATASHLEAAGYFVDRQASDASRFWYLPSIPAVGVPYVFWTCTGAPIDVEAALAAVPEPPPPPAPRPRPLASGGPSAFDRARAYLAKCEPAIQGSNGRTTTLVTAMRLVKGFALSEADAFELMTSWNQRCSPPWSERDLRTKIREAASKGFMPEGALLDRERGR